jgi:hypothetical protein
MNLNYPNASIFIIVMIALNTSCAQLPENSISIHADQVISPASEFIGNGVEWSAYPHADSERAEWGLLMTDEKWQQVFHRLDYMQPQIVRVVDQANWRYLEGLDENGDPVLDFENQEMQALYRLLDYCEENNITVILGEWGEPYEVHETHLNLQDAFSGANDPAWINIIVQHLDYLINTKNYSVIKYYNLVNEPNGYWASTNGDWDQWKEGVLMLDEALDEAGLKETVSVIGPDATPYNNEDSKYTGYEWVIESVKQLSYVFTAYDVHDYPVWDYVRSGEFQRHYTGLVHFADSVARKPFIFGEIGFEKWTEDNLARVEEDPYASNDSQLSIYDFDYGVDMADVLVQAMNSGVDATLAWGLDDAMHTNGDTGDKTQLKKWGMWNILGTELTGDPEEEKIRPWFYTWSLMSRFYPGEMNIVASDSIPEEGVRMVVGISEDENITITIVNNSDQAASFPIHLEDISSSVSLKKYLYSDSVRPVNSDDFPVPLEENLELNRNNGLEVEIPSKSVIVYTSYRY